MNPDDVQMVMSAAAFVGGVVSMIKHGVPSDVAILLLFVAWAVWP